MLALLEPATECAETKMRQANFAPAGDTAFPFGFARPDNSDTSFDAKARRIAARGLRFPVDIVAKTGELLRRAEVEPPIGLPSDAPTNAVNRQACGTDPHWDRFLDRQRINTGTGETVVFTFEVDNLFRPQTLEELHLLFAPVAARVEIRTQSGVFLWVLRHRYRGAADHRRDCLASPLVSRPRRSGGPAT